MGYRIHNNPLYTTFLHLTAAGGDCSTSMESAQDRILAHVERIALSKSFEVAVAQDASNVGQVLVYRPGEPVACCAVHYEFYPEDFILKVLDLVQGVPRTCTHAELQRHCLRYTQPHPFWSIFEQWLNRCAPAPAPTPAPEPAPAAAMTSTLALAALSQVTPRSMAFTTARPGPSLART